MDSFKVSELALMAAGGNKPWQDFFNAHPTNKLEGRTFDDCTTSERYRDSEAADEWRERLSAKVDGREFDKAAFAEEQAKMRERAAAKKTPLTNSGVLSSGGSRSSTPVSRTASNSKPTSRSASPALGTSSISGANAPRKQQNEAFLARMGAENASRPPDLPPSRGGKYGGFGSEWPPAEPSNAPAPNLDEFQRDPVKALTRGFGWLSTTVGKGAQEGLKRVRF